MGDIILADFDNVDSALFVTGCEEPIGDHDRSEPEYIVRHDLDVVWPLQFDARGLELALLELVNTTIYDSILNVRHYKDAAIADGVEAGGEQEWITTLESGHGSVGWVVNGEVTEGIPGDVRHGARQSREHSDSD